MHPIFKSSRSFFAVLLFWLFISLVVALLVGDVVTPHLRKGVLLDNFALIIPWYFVFIFICFSNIYICERLPFAQVSPLRAVSIQIASLIISVAMWMLLGYWWSLELQHFEVEDASKIYFHSLSINVMLGAILYAIWILVHYVYLEAAANETESSEQLEKKLLVSDIELQAIKATVHPHFMYNSLNMLANLSLTAPEKIHSLCVQMAEFLRYSVNYAKKKRVSVADEVTHIKNYLAIEQERFGEHLQLEFFVDDAAEPHTVMPLLLFPLVENAIKHGIDSSTEAGYLKVAITLRDSWLDIVLENSFDKSGSKVLSTGIGLTTLRKRIYSYYGPVANIRIEKSDSVYRISLVLPLTEKESTA